MFTARLMSSVAVVALVAALPAQADVKISDKPTQNMSCSDGVCSPTAKDAVLNITDLANMLAGGDVTVNTAGTLAKDIDISAALSWASTSRLTLDAYRSVTVNKPVSVTGAGAVTITLNDGGTGGDLLFVNKGSLTFWDVNSSLIIDGNAYTLVGDIKTLSSDIAANPSGLYALANDYDASIDGTYTDSPVATTLQGTFEGLGHTISNLTISTQNVLNTGFFAQIGSAGAVRDVALRHANVSSDVGSLNGALGALAGENDGVVAGVNATGSVSGAVGLNGAAGGLVGIDKGGIAAVNVNVKLAINSDTAIVGGIAGLVDGTNSAAQITRSLAAGDIAGSVKGAVGGLVGASNYGVIQLSQATGAVKGSGDSAVGGLIGTNQGSVDQSFATGSVEVQSSNHKGCYSDAGGLIGWNDATVINSYSTGVASGGADACIGGLIGKDTGSSSASYATGQVTGGTGAQVGGFAGKFYKGDATASDCYWDTDTSGTDQASGNKASVKGITGLTTQQLQSGLPGGFDTKIWAEDSNINGGFPYLLANPPK